MVNSFPQLFVRGQDGTGRIITADNFNEHVSWLSENGFHSVDNEAGLQYNDLIVMEDPTKAAKNTEYGTFKNYSDGRISSAPEAEPDRFLVAIDDRWDDPNLPEYFEISRYDGDGMPRTAADIRQLFVDNFMYNGQDPYTRDMNNGHGNYFSYDIIPDSAFDFDTLLNNFMTRGKFFSAESCSGHRNWSNNFNSYVGSIIVPPGDELHLVDEADSEWQTILGSMDENEILTALREVFGGDISLFYVSSDAFVDQWIGDDFSIEIRTALRDAGILNEGFRISLNADVSPDSQVWNDAALAEIFEGVNRSALITKISTALQSAQQLGLLFEQLSEIAVDGQITEDRLSQLLPPGMTAAQFATDLNKTSGTPNQPVEQQEPDGPGDQTGGDPLDPTDPKAVQDFGKTTLGQVQYSIAAKIDNINDAMMNMAQNTDGIDEPGELFALQQTLQNYKDQIATFTAMGKMLGDVLSEARRFFAQALSR